MYRRPIFPGIWYLGVWWLSYFQHRIIQESIGHGNEVFDLTFLTCISVYLMVVFELCLHQFILDLIISWYWSTVSSLSNPHWIFASRASLSRSLLASLAMVLIKLIIRVFITLLDIHTLLTWFMVLVVKLLWLTLYAYCLSVRISSWCDWGIFFDKLFLLLYAHCILFYLYAYAVLLVLYGKPDGGESRSSTVCLASSAEPCSSRFSFFSISKPFITLIDSDISVLSLANFSVRAVKVLTMSFEVL